MQTKQMKVEDNGRSFDVLFFYSTFNLSTLIGDSYREFSVEKAIPNDFDINSLGIQAATLITRLILNKEILGIEKIKVSQYEFTVVKYHGFDWKQGEDNGIYPPLVQVLKEVYGDFVIKTLLKYINNPRVTLKVN